MSTFNGFIEEISGISVDRFTELNFQSKLFFLSHCHADHMIGLSEITLENALPGPIYLSEVSLVIVRRKFPNVENLIPLKIGEPTPISIINDYNEVKICFTVIAIPAGHCPGSIMLLFEQNNRNVLYTGDFRLYHENIKSISALKKFHRNEAMLDALYVDSTFFSHQYQHFPTQSESIETIIKLTEDWLQKDNKNIVILRPPANYGYEYLLIKLSEHFDKKIHVTGPVFEDYIHIPDFDSHIDDLKRSSGRIHLCSSAYTMGINWHKKKCSCLPALNEKFICIIRPTAMKWSNLQKTDLHHEAHGSIENVHFVCYSNHASYDEIKHFIQYLKPKKVNLNVIPDDVKRRLKMENALNLIQNEYQKMDLKAKCDVDLASEYRFSKIVSAKLTRSTLSLDDDISHIKIRRRQKD